MNTRRLSFVIPARDESQLIGHCLNSVKTWAASLAPEIVVVDNGSEDDTAGIAQSLGARVISRAVGTIGYLRNEGASIASGDYLVFLDSDVVLTEAWSKRIAPALTEMQRDDQLITGSHCFAPESDPLWVRSWYNAFAREPAARHLGAAHLIIRTEHFRALKGFSESLETGEDYEFCVRAVATGAHVRNDPELVTYHLAFPKSVADFIKREAWHGRGDVQTISDLRASPVAMAACMFLVLHLSIGASVAARHWAMLLVCLVALAGLLFGSSLWKFRHCSFRDIFGNAWMFYPYYLGRSTAILNRICC